MTRRQNRKPAATAANELGLERIVFFSDAVMAIAITLLVIDLKLPELPAAQAAAQLPALLGELAPRLMSFVISFTVVGIFWASHHRYFTYIRRYDGRLIILNMIFLLFIALIPFSASVLGQYAALPLGMIVYGANVVGVGLAIAALWWYASGGYRLIDASMSRDAIRTRSYLALAVPLIFLISLPFALINPWLTIAIWWLAPFAALVTRQVLFRHPARA